MHKEGREGEREREGETGEGSRREWGVDQEVRAGSIKERG